MHFFLVVDIRKRKLNQPKVNKILFLIVKLILIWLPMLPIWFGYTMVEWIKQHDIDILLTGPK